MAGTSSEGDPSGQRPNCLIVEHKMIMRSTRLSSRKTLPPQRSGTTTCMLVGACGGRAGLHIDRCAIGLGARLYGRDKEIKRVKFRSASRPRSFYGRYPASGFTVERNLDPTFLVDAIAFALDPCASRMISTSGSSPTAAGRGARLTRCRRELLFCCLAPLHRQHIAEGRGAGWGHDPASRPL